jgi:4-hydroxy-3-methylbut-2-enyl diphosphate reductase
VGLAVAARQDDDVALVVARATVEQWRRTLRTRRVLVAGSETTCAGARRAMALAGVQGAVREYADRGDTVLVIGRMSDAVTAGLVGQAPADVLVVSSVGEAGEVLVDDPDRVSFVLSPAMATEDAVTVLAELRSRFPRLRGQHPDEWCYAVSDRRLTTRAVADSSDLLLVVGGLDDPESQELAAASCQVRQLTDAGQLRANWLATAATVGIVGTSSDEVIRVLSGLGPLSVVRRQITTEVVGDWECDVTRQAHYVTTG